MGPEAGEAGYGYIEDNERVFEGAEGMEIVGSGTTHKESGGALSVRISFFGGGVKRQRIKGHRTPSCQVCGEKGSRAGPSGGSKGLGVGREQKKGGRVSQGQGT